MLLSILKAATICDALRNENLFPIPICSPFLVLLSFILVILGRIFSHLEGILLADKRSKEAMQDFLFSFFFLLNYRFSFAALSLLLAGQYQHLLIKQVGIFIDKPKDLVHFILLFHILLAHLNASSIAQWQYCVTRVGLRSREFILLDVE